MGLGPSKAALANYGRYRAHAYRRAQQYGSAEKDYYQASKAGESFEQGGTPWRSYYYGPVLWIMGKKSEALDAFSRMHDVSGRATFSDARRFLLLSPHYSWWLARGL